MAYTAAFDSKYRLRATLGSHVIICILGIVAACLALAAVAYMVWPKTTPLPPDAPSVPVTVGGMSFNVPPAAVRFKMQRRPGSHARIDMVFLWPTLEPPNPNAKPLPGEATKRSERLFVTIAAADNAFPPLERLRLIYPRYTDDPPIVGSDGLSVQTFGDITPYQGEDLLQDPLQPERFLLRCTRPTGPTVPTCLHERRLGGADVTIRFPRAWLSDWRSVADGIDHLLAGIRSNVP